MIPELLKFDTIDALSIGSTTLVGAPYGEFPLKFGNCFSVRTKDGYIDILNFIVENLKHLLVTEVIEWPIKITILEGRYGVINDERIPDEYYDKGFCESCCPMHLLPLPQRLQRARMITAGIDRYSQTTASDGLPAMLIRSTKITAVAPKLKPGWTFDFGPDATNP